MRSRYLIGGNHRQKRNNEPANYSLFLESFNTLDVLRESVYSRNWKFTAAQFRGTRVDLKMVVVSLKRVVQLKFNEGFRRGSSFCSRTTKGPE